LDEASFLPASEQGNFEFEEAAVPFGEFHGAQIVTPSGGEKGPYTAETPFILDARESVPSNGMDFFFVFLLHFITNTNLLRSRIG
jgi:hypothetical protein